ncbi:prefoldin subunit alpha [Candidatus Woesearchaeota archaeon]|nr:prefoldin subunit alpha [Candidatus Woesearchaeota archaeon]
MEKKIDEEELQRRYMEFQQMRKDIKQGQQQVDAIEEQLGAMESLVECLEQLKKVEVGSEMLNVISEGIFVKTTLNDNKEIIVNVGAGVAVPKSIDETKELIRSRIQQGEKHRDMMLGELQSMMMQAKKAEENLASMIE